LTYSVIGTAEEPHLSGGVLPSYRRLAQALVAALRNLGLPADMKGEARLSSLRNPNPVCFEVPSTYEITVTGKKLIGSAQARRKEGVLQHGSLPLTGDLTRILQVLVFKDEQSRLEAGERLLERAATVETLLGKAIAWQQAADAMLEGFRSVLEVDLQNGGLTARERERAGELAEIKYSRL
jgi:lipoate-protein ligase A